jgi:hypothetical protein
VTLLRKVWTAFLLWRHREWIAAYEAEEARNERKG